MHYLEMIPLYRNMQQTHLTYTKWKTLVCDKTAYFLIFIIIIIIITTVCIHLRLNHLSDFHEIPYRPFYTTLPSKCEFRENRFSDIILYVRAGQHQATGGLHISLRTRLRAAYIYIYHIVNLSFVKSGEEKALRFGACTKLHLRTYHATLLRVESKERLGKVYAMRYGVQHLLSSCIKSRNCS